MNYFNFLPEELVTEVIVYLDIDEIKLFQTFYGNKLDLTSKLFWINKLKYDKLEEYIPFLGITKGGNYLGEYESFVDTDENVNNFMTGFKRVRSNLVFYILPEVDTEELINTIDIGEFDKMTVGEMEVIDLVDVIQFEYMNRKYKFVRTSNRRMGFTPGEITEKQFKLLLIKLELVGYNIFALSDLEEQYEALNEY